MPDDRLEFEITWNGAVPARLVYLTVGSDIVLPAETAPHADGAARITLSFDRAAAKRHLFRWGLLFPGRELEGLRAVARVNGGVLQEVRRLDTAVRHKWTSSGTARRGL